MANTLTDTALRGKWRGKDRWLSDGGSRGAGRLVAKLGEGGATFYFQHFDGERRKRFYPIGAHDSGGRRGCTLQAARDRAAQLSLLYRSGVTDLHAHFQREQAARDKASRDEEVAARRAADASKRYTVRKLLEQYVEYLRRGGKEAARDAESIFKLHVYAVGDFADKPAAELTARAATELLRRIVEKGRGRTAAKARAYMRAAFALALRAELEPDAPSGLIGFDLPANPIAPTGALSQYSRALERVLSREVLGAYVKKLDELPDGITRDALRLHLLLGGQRTAQLLRATVADYDPDAKILTLRDPKGARKQARLHAVPLIGEAEAIVARLVKKRRELGWDLLFTSDGEHQTRPETLTAAVAGMVRAMRAETESEALKAGATTAVALKKAESIDFELRDVRRTVETMLASMGVSRETRAQLQSHGLGGVQQRHYDKHSYLDEKRSALTAWSQRLRAIADGESKSNIVELHQATKSRRKHRA